MILRRVSFAGYIGHMRDIAEVRRVALMRTMLLNVLQLISSNVVVGLILEASLIGLRGVVPPLELSISISLPAQGCRAPMCCALPIRKLRCEFLRLLVEVERLLQLAIHPNRISVFDEVLGIVRIMTNESLEYLCGLRGPLQLI